MTHDRYVLNMNADNKHTVVEMHGLIKLRMFVPSLILENEYMTVCMYIHFYFHLITSTLERWRGLSDVNFIGQKS